MSCTKTLSRADYLTALALYTLANEHFKKMNEFEAALARHLGYEGNYLGHLSDTIGGGCRSFDEALKLEGFIVDEKAST